MLPFSHKSIKGVEHWRAIKAWLPVVIPVHPKSGVKVRAQGTQTVLSTYF